MKKGIGKLILLAISLTTIFMLGGHLTYMLGQKSIPTKSDVRAKLSKEVYHFMSYAESKMVNGKEMYRDVGWGTAFVVKHKKGQYFVTNAHVCMGEDRHGLVYVGGDKKIYLKIKALDDKVDLCLLETKKNNKLKLKKEIGLRVANKESVIGGVYGSLGFNGFEYSVAQLGEKLGSRIIPGIPLDIDHRPNNLLRVINNLRLSDPERRAMCPDPNIILTMPNPVALMLQMMGAPPEELRKIPNLYQCMTAEKQDIYDFFIVGGASGSPVIDLKTKQIVGVVSRYVHPERHYGGVIPQDVVKGFLDANIK